MYWPWQRKDDISIDAGAVYRSAKSRVVETATVMEQFDDYDGIPHVRYALQTHAPCGDAGSREMRVLALSAFAERYSEYCGRADGI